MPKFKFEFRREYTITEGFDREIEADTLEQAQATADGLAPGFDMDCPDDCSEDESGHSEIGDFEATPAFPHNIVDSAWEPDHASGVNTLYDCA